MENTGFPTVGFQPIQYSGLSAARKGVPSDTTIRGLADAVGINLIKKEDIPLFIDHLERIGPKDYFEKAIENMINTDRVTIVPVDINNLFCMDIDFVEDLEKVKRYIATIE